jgi:excinuclease ABC subunit B
VGSEMCIRDSIGRAARNIDGKVILYADTITNSIQQALDETNRRREKQQLHNITNNITPKSIKKNISDIVQSKKDSNTNTTTTFKSIKELQKQIKQTQKLMIKEAKNLNFEAAAKLRDKLKNLEKTELKLLN